MDKKKFLSKLKKALVKLTPEERQKYISYYDEMISDLVDGGLEEDEAVKKQGNVNDVAQEILSQVDVDSLIKKNIWELVLLTVCCLLSLASTIVLIALPDVVTFALMEANGPTSVFVAGKINEPFWLYIITVIALVVGIIIFSVRKKLKYIIALVVALFVFGITFVVVRLDDGNNTVENVTTEESAGYSKLEIEERTILVIELVSQDDYASLRDSYSIPEMKEVLNDDYMLEVKTMISDNWGELISVGNIYYAEMSQNNIDYIVVQVNATYENVPIAYTITFDMELKLAGIYMR